MPRLPVTLVLMATIIMPHPATAEPWPDIRGRWRAKARVRHTLPIQAIEIARCPGGLCGRVLNEDERCGPVVLRLTENRTGTLRGTILVAGAGMPAYAALQTPDWLLLGAFRPPANPPRKILPLIAEYDREGPARCASTAD